MKISAYVRNRYLEPSGYYRVTQYLAKLPYECSIHSMDTNIVYRADMYVRKYQSIHLLWQVIHYVCYLCRISFFLLHDFFKKTDVVIVSRSFFPRICPQYFVKSLSYLLRDCAVIWDFDDNILGLALTKNECKFLCYKADRIIITQAELAKIVLPEFSNKVVLLPTTDGDMVGYDYDVITRNRLNCFPREIHILWLAMSSNLPYLKMTIGGLERAASILGKSGKKLVLEVVCNLPLSINTQNLVIRNIEWTREISKEKLLQCHIGIMPLADNEFTRGKGAFKLIQYMAVGMPVIASDVGFNSEVVKDNFGVKVSKENLDEEWENAVSQLIRDEKEWLQYSRAAKEEWDKNYSYEKALDTWRKILEDIYGCRQR